MSTNSTRARAANAAVISTPSSSISWVSISPSSLGIRIDARIKIKERAQKAIWSQRSVRNDQL